jgi:NIMA (never in mitosis gene a)-related kinase
LSEKEKENALNEVRILASITHPNVIAYKEAFFEEATQTLCIVMEYADGGDI